jgi:hypothetical protein
MSDVNRRDFLKRAATTVGGAAVGVGLPAAVVLPNAQRLAQLCPVNTYLKSSVPTGAERLPLSAAAEERLARVPAGFMREVAHTQGAKLALERGESEISAASVEDAIIRVTGWMNHATGHANPVS